MSQGLGHYEWEMLAVYAPTIALMKAVNLSQFHKKSRV